MDASTRRRRGRRGTGRSRTEAGQVTPALLLAVIGGFALAVGFVSLQFLTDQTGRAATASDAAALAVGAEQRTEVEESFGAGGLGALTGLQDLLTRGPAVRADAVAAAYARANGATLAGPVVFEGFDLGQHQWVYRVTTRQVDKVRGGTSTAQSQSTSKVAVQISSGLCTQPLGLVVNGSCASLTDLITVCETSLQPPPAPPTQGPTDGPTDGPSDGPTEAPTADPTDQIPANLQGVGCVDPADVLGWDIHLTE